jgi:putative transposase
METIELNDRQQKIADFRFGIIADLVYSHAEKSELARQIAAKAAREWEIPYSRKTTITASCIRKWLVAFRDKGRDALVPKVRKDSGQSKVLTEADKELILGLLEQKPQLCASVAVKVLQREGKLVKNVSRSSLSRFIQSSGFTRAERQRTKSRDQVQPFSFSQPLECVQVDAMHSFAVPDHRGKLRKAILIAFLDDATRRVVYARFCFSENSVEFEQGIHHILQSHGRIRQIYTDNGSTFVAEQTKLILASLGILLTHSKPGVPKGRGKIERFFRTVRTQFEATLNPPDIQGIYDYDQRFHTWLEREYHRTGHSSLQGQTPLEAWLAGSRFIFRLDPTINLAEVFCHQTTRTVASDATISLDGIAYEVASVLRGRKVRVKTNPLSDVPVVRVFFEGKDYGSAKRIDEYANARSRRIMAPDDPAQAALRSSQVAGGTL